jgi:voltage-gated potassium channel
MTKSRRRTITDVKPEGFSNFREKLYEIIFEADTAEGKLFDVVLLIMIFLSIIIVMLETVPDISPEFYKILYTAEWIITIFFTLEYLLRLYCVYNPVRYAKSFFGIIDLVAILPSFLTFIFPAAHTFMMVRGLRLLRVFRIFKLHNFLHQGNIILRALGDSRAKISVFLFFILLMVSIFGSLMYLVEHNVNPGFTSIPKAIYWAIVTITTVGYGDMAPMTAFGQFIASLIMITGYAVIAVPTGIVTSALMKSDTATDRDYDIQCAACNMKGHARDASFCRNCGHEL